MLLAARDIRVSTGEKKPTRSPPTTPAISRVPIKIGLGPWKIAGSVGSLSVGNEVKMCDFAVRGFSHESEHDLAILVSDFLENGSCGTESRCSSDSESGFSDLHHLADRISFWKRTAEQYENDLLSDVHSLIVSIKESDLEVVNNSQCNGSCIRQSLVKLLKSSGYDAAVCLSTWNGDGKFPGGDHEYIDIVTDTHKGTTERLVIEIDFQSHFEIARAVESYESLLSSLPVVYVGSLERIDQFLQIMVEATRWSLKQNSMPLPPWRSFPYLQAKWHSPYERCSNLDESNDDDHCGDSRVEHEPCIETLKRLKTSLWSEIDLEHYFKQLATNDKKCDNKRRTRIQGRQRPSLLSS